MPDTRCDLTELPPDMCSHCRGLDAEPKPELTVRSISIARFDGRCGVCDKHTIKVDGPLYRVDLADGGEAWAGPCCGDV